jgi:Ferritin-like domain
MSDLTLAELDRDGALLEPLTDLAGSSRAEFLSRAALGGSALVAALVAPDDAAAQKSRKRDVAILNFALSLEYLQDSFYTEVERLGGFRGALGRQARVVGAHERAHVVALRDVLGRRAVKRGRYDFRGATESRDAFRRTAVAFEDLAVAAYKGQAPRIANTAYLVAALGIHTVEARHAAWIRRLADRTPAENAFDEPRSRKSTLGVVASTKFVVQTRSRRSPRFTG